MVVEITAYFRRLARTGSWILAGALSLCGVAAAQTPPAVTTGSVIPLPHSIYNQIYQIVYWQGNVLLLDTAASILYQIPPGSTTITAIATPSNSPLCSNSCYWNDGMAIDNEGNLYIGNRYPGASTGLFLRVPYNSSTGTWDVTAGDWWGNTIEDSSGNGLNGDGSGPVAFLDSGKGDGSGTLYWMSTADQAVPTSIFEQQVGAGGSLVGTATSVISNLMADQGKIAVDANGDIFFVEFPGTSDADRVNGVYFIGAGNIGLTAENQAEALTPSNYNGTNPPNKFNGVTLDPAGNLYLTSESDGYGGTWNGELVIPNSCGNSQYDVYDGTPCYKWANVSYISPVGSNNPLMVDPRGFLWIPAYGAWSFTGSSTYGGAEDTTNNYCPGGACNFVVWAMGSDSLGASPIGTVSATGTVFVNFNTAETLGNTGFSQPGQPAGTSNVFATTTTNPYPDSTATTPTTACTAGTQYSLQTSCPVWLTMTPQAVGPVTAELTLADSNNNQLSGSTTYLNGVGEGPMAALLGTPGQTAMAAGLSNPDQVAVDTLGNVYVADSTLGEVLVYPAGASAATGSKIGTGLKAPTGVAVDGVGDVYIADSGNIYELPAANGVPGAGTQTTLFASGTVVSDANGDHLALGSDLNLAVDGIGDVYAADPSDGQVVKIDNPQMADSQSGFTVVGTGFKAPSAVAVDNSGDLFVADSPNLYEITTWGLQTKIASTLASSVTGLAVEPSGSIDVAQEGGTLRIPSLGGSFTVNDAAPIDTALTSPNGVTIDNQGNLYVSDMTGGTPNLYELNVTTSGSYNFGSVGLESEQQGPDLDVYNVGNAPLAFSANPTFGGADASWFSLTTPATTPCDITGATTVESGGSCAFGLQVEGQTASPPPAAGTVSVTSTAANGTLTANLTANVLNLIATTTTVALNPTTTTFPGSTTATINIAPTASTSTTAALNGDVTVTLTSTVQGSTQPPITFTGQATGTSTAATATVDLNGLPGGSYNVKAAYQGNGTFGSSSASTTLTVAPAQPLVVMSEPNGIQPNSTNGIYYVKNASTTTMTITVSSLLGTPTGTVTVMNGTQPADQNQENEPLNADGQATFNLQGLQPGTYSLTAVYSGDTNFESFSSALVSFQILNPSVLLSASPASLSTPAGTPVSSTITLQSIVGFASTGVNITCSNVPQYSECTFNNPQPALCAPPGTAAAPCSGITTTVVTLSTNIPVNVGSLPAETSPFALAGIFGLGLLGLGLRKRRLVSRGVFNALCLILLLTGAILGFSGCTNSGYTQTPPAPHDVTPSGTTNMSIVVTDESSDQVYSLPFTIPVTISSSSSN